CVNYAYLLLVIYAGFIVILQLISDGKPETDGFHEWITVSGTLVIATVQVGVACTGSRSIVHEVFGAFVQWQPAGQVFSANAHPDVAEAGFGYPCKRERIANLQVT